MKVFQINSVVSYGSTGRIARDLSNVLEDMGHESIIAFGRGADNSNFNTFKIGNIYDQFAHLLITRINDRHGFYSRSATEKLIKKISEYDPDIIQIHNLHGYYINIKLLFDYLSKINVPVVWLLHDQWPISGHSANFELTDDGKIPQSLQNKKMLREYPATYGFSQFEKNYFDKKNIFTKPAHLNIITPSKWLQKIIEKSFLNVYPIKTIQNGIDDKVFRRVKSNRYRTIWGAQDKVVLLGVAYNWGPTKGLLDFVRLSNLLPKSQFQIVLVGVDKKVQKDIPEHIISIEKTENVDELVGIYNEADLFLNLTYKDNFPTVNIEALSCGTPVITYNTGGSAECLFDSTMGFSVETGDLNRIVNYLTKNIKEIKGMNALKDQRSRKAKEFFSKRNTYARYLELYQEILDNKSNS